MRRLAQILGLIALFSAPVAAEVQNPLLDQGSWPELAFDIIGETHPSDGAPIFTVDAPYRAHDAAIVPIMITQTDASHRITALDLVVDENPAPLAAHIEFGPAMHPLSFETRVRVNQYSNVRAIAKTVDGLFMAGRFVKASGGCSAPATKDPAAALAGIGTMRLRAFSNPSASSGARREVQIMIRHPNYSGLQRNQITQLFITAHFIDELEVWQGDDMLFTLTGGISISENPVFRFTYTDNGAPTLRVRARDTEGNLFERILPTAS